MSTQAGWYPDPSGTPGLFRYWDGTQWTPAVSRAPFAPPPGSAPYGSAPYGSAPYGSAPYAAGQQGAPSAYRPSGPPGGNGSAASPGTPPVPGSPTPRRGAIGWWLAAAAIVIVLVLVVVGAVRLSRVLAPGAGPGGEPTTQVCPPSSFDSPSPEAEPTDGRVHGGKLSFPQLADPFGPVVPEYEVPFARDTHQQMVLVEPDYDGPGNDWVATVMVGDLFAGDGFFTPQDGSRIVVDCVVGRFYGDAQVTRHDVRNEATTIDGHDAWVVESQLSFDIAGLKTKGELMIVAIVSTGPAGSGIYYASIPDTTPELVAPARQALAGLTVSG